MLFLVWVGPIQSIEGLKRTEGQPSLRKGILLPGGLPTETGALPGLKAACQALNPDWDIGSAEFGLAASVITRANPL